MKQEEVDNLLNLVTRGEVSEDTLGEVARELQSSNPSVDPYLLLHVLGKGSGDTSYRFIVEPILWRSDRFIAGKALQVLYWDWQLGEWYTEEIERLLRGVSQEDDAQRIAISIAGDYLRTHSNPRLLRALLEVFEGGTANDQRSPYLKLAAYESLLDSMAWKQSQTAPPTNSTERSKHETSIDFEVIRAARERLLIEEGNS